MELAGHKCLGFCEWDKYARASYISMHCITEEQRAYLATLDLKKRQKEILKEEYLNGEWCSTDIREVTADNIPKADCWCFGAPCFTEDTMILTYEGYKRIVDVVVGDLVLTHKGRWRKVTSTMHRDNAELWFVKGFGILPTITTAEHPYYIAKDKDSDLEFVQIKDITDNVWSSICLPDVKDNSFTSEWWWIAGRYLADGWLSDRKERPHSGRVVISCNDQKLDCLVEHIEKAGYHCSITHERSCNKVQIANNQLYEDLMIFGKYAYGKRIPGIALELPKEKALAFFEGYMSGDGRCDKEEATSVSSALILGMALIALRCGKNHPGIWKSVRPHTAIIENRTVSQRDTYTFRIANRSIKSYERNGYTLRRLYRPIKLHEYGTVYNISVDEDESYVANGAIVHNCQDFSIAGKRAGLEGDRSSLVREVFRIIEHLSEEDRPEWLIYENVKGMLSSNRGFDFLSIILEMDRWGYDTEWQLLNSKLHGVPQNRERVYTIGHLRKYGTKKIFPIPATNGKDSTGEVKINLIGHREGYHRNLQTFGADGITETLSTCDGGGREHHVAVPLSGGLKKEIKESETASTLMARDYKGIANFCGNMAGYKVETASDINQIGHLGGKNRDNPSRYRVYSDGGIAPCMQTYEGGGLEPHVAVTINKEKANE